MVPPDSDRRRCWAEIDLGALRHNVEALRAPLPAGAGIMAVVKANAYGHGKRGVAAALAGRVEMFGVANVLEAHEIGKYAPAVPILILGPALPAERRDIIEHGFIPSVSDLAEAAAFAEAGNGRRVPVHVIVDTGMGRIGVWQDDALATVREILRVPQIEVTGIASHLPVADEDDAFTDAQLVRFHRLAAEIRALGLERATIHIENSASALRSPGQAGSLVRAGLALYGSAPLPEFQERLRPVLTWKARITLVREVGAGRGISYGRTFITPRPMRIATIGAGYADGFQRHLSNRGAEVLIGGKRCAVLGRVTMDQILADVSAVPEARAGDEVVLLGRQGSEEILAAEMAAKAGTIVWEIFTGIGPRVERVNV
jgi:alanine racemase